MAPSTSNMISAIMKCVQEHGSPVNLQSVLVISCFTCKVSSLFRALYARCPYYLKNDMQTKCRYCVLVVLYMHSPGLCQIDCCATLSSKRCPPRLTPCPGLSPSSCDGGDSSLNEVPRRGFVLAEPEWRHDTTRQPSSNSESVPCMPGGDPAQWF